MVVGVILYFVAVTCTEDPEIPSYDRCVWRWVFLGTIPMGMSWLVFLMYWGLELFTGQYDKVRPRGNSYYRTPNA